MGNIPAVYHSAFQRSPEATDPRVRVRTAGAGGRCQDVRLGLVRVALNLGHCTAWNHFAERRV